MLAGAGKGGTTQILTTVIVYGVITFSTNKLFLAVYCSAHESDGQVSFLFQLIQKYFTVILDLQPFRFFTSSLAIIERPCSRVDQFWPKVEDDILQTI